MNVFDKTPAAINLVHPGAHNTTIQQMHHIKSKLAGTRDNQSQNSSFSKRNKRLSIVDKKGDVIKGSAS
jgi:hypothetical protein